MNLLFGLILGLFALVHSLPFYAVTQIPANGEDDVLREAVTDGFLIDYLYDSTTTESPKRNTTVQVTQQPPEKEEERTQTTTYPPVVFEASGEGGSGEEFSTTVQLRDDQPSSTTPSVFPVESSAPRNTEPAVYPSPSTLSPDSVTHFSPDLGSGDGEIFGSSPDTPFSTTSIPIPNLSATSQHDYTEQHTSRDASTVPSTSTATLVTHNAPRMLGETQGSGSGIPVEVTTAEEIRHTVVGTSRVAAIPPHGPAPNTELANRGQGTPGWIIIVGFVVGLAAVIMLFVAIATREKWNGPSQASQVTDLNNTNQPREQEMETFLHKQTPRENGQTAEYTVIPLEDLPNSEKD
ncbi:uncharacterized protein LOC143005013 [Genypterus blacodes]|uniref:uncharacterized protein LOC143005013 n=1 Tax=Genypterus blacodes TaxID=154954 RepID=UPI003F76B1CD